MKLYYVSQLPVMEGDRVVGLLDEWDLLKATQKAPRQFAEAVRTAMTQKIETVGLNTPLATLMDAFERGHVAIVVEGGNFYGLITRIDALNHLRRNVAL